VRGAARGTRYARQTGEGSIVAPNYLRFDFTHYQPMTEDEVKKSSGCVNERALRNVVDTDVMPVEEAMRSGRDGAVRRKILRDDAGADGARLSKGFAAARMCAHR
jgi:hypothetical protein